MGSIIYKINKEIEARHINKSDFADKIGVSRDTVYNWTDDSIKVSVLKRVSEFFDMDIIEFLSDDKGKQQEPKKGKTNVILELDSTDVLKIDIKNKKLEILKK